MHCSLSCMLLDPLLLSTCVYVCVSICLSVCHASPSLPPHNRPAAALGNLSPPSPLPQRCLHPPKQLHLKSISLSLSLSLSLAPQSSSFSANKLPVSLSQRGDALDPPSSIVPHVNSLSLSLSLSFSLTPPSPFLATFPSPRKLETCPQHRDLCRSIPK